MDVDEEHLTTHPERVESLSHVSAGAIDLHSCAAVMANRIENFEPVFNKQLENLFSARMNDNGEIFMRLMNDESFRNVAASYLMRTTYKQVKAAGN